MAWWRNSLPTASSPLRCGETRWRGEKAQNQVLHQYPGTKVVPASKTFTSIGYLAVLPWYHCITLKVCEDNLFVLTQVTQGIATSNHKWIKKHNRRLNGFSSKIPHWWIWVWRIPMLISYWVAGTVIFFPLPPTAPSCPVGMCYKSHLGSLRPQKLFWQCYDFLYSLAKGYRVGSHGFYAKKINMFMQLHIILI